MKIKPWPIIVLATLHILAPFGNFIFNAWRLNHTLQQQWLYWFEIYPKHLLTLSLLSPIVAGIAIYVCKKWSYYVYLACLALIFSLNLYAFSTSLNLSTFFALIAVTLFDLLAVAYFVLPSVKRIYLDPRMRWWEALPRYHFNQVAKAGEHSLQIVNLSLGGALARSTKRFPDNSELELTWEESPKIKANVVYQGIIHGQDSTGLKFNHTPETEKYIKSLIRKLEKEKAVIQERLPGPEDGFLPWLIRLVTTGEGLFPKR